MEDGEGDLDVELWTGSVCFGKAVVVMAENIEKFSDTQHQRWDTATRTSETTGESENPRG